MSDDLLDTLLNGGGKTFFSREDAVGRSVTGVVTAVSTRQTRSLDTGQPETWDDGSPKLQTAITLATGERDPLDPEDDGRRVVYVKMWGEQLNALRRAARQAGGKPVPGDTFTATFTGTTPPPAKGLNPSKVYEFKIAKPLDGDPAPNADVPPSATTAPPAWATGDPQGATSSGTAQQAQPAQPAAAGGPDLSKVPALRAAGVPDAQIAAAIGATLAQVQGA